MGWFECEIWRKGEKICEFLAPNTVYSWFVDHLNDCTFTSGTTLNSYYMSVISTLGYTGIATTDTMASHPGWEEWPHYTSPTRISIGDLYSVSTQYSQRLVSYITPNLPTPTYLKPDAPGVARFNMTASGHMAGLFIATDGTKGGTIGSLVVAADFSSISIGYGVGIIPFNTGDVFAGRYSFTIRSPERLPTDEDDGA